MTSYTEEACPNKSDCDDPYHNHSMTQREKIEQLLENYAGRILTYEKKYLIEHHDPRRLNADRDHAVNLTATQIETLITEARLDERNKVALDNYRGNTFSDSTNYEAKFAKFIDNNNKRILTLQASLKGKEV